MYLIRTCSSFVLLIAQKKSSLGDEPSQPAPEEPAAAGSKQDHRGKQVLGDRSMNVIDHVNDDGKHGNIAKGARKNGRSKSRKTKQLLPELDRENQNVPVQVKASKRKQSEDEDAFVQERPAKKVAKRRSDENQGVAPKDPGVWN